MIALILVFLIELSILVLIHELGHFISARSSGVLVEEFGFGLPPRIFGKRIGETIYSINLLPFGGFVRLHGESDQEKITHTKKAFLNKGKGIRAKIILAGVVMNFGLAVAAFSFVYFISGVPRENEKVRIVEVKEGSPAQASGLKPGDFIEEVEGVKVFSNQEFIDFVEAKRGSLITLRVERPGVGVLELKAIPRENPPPGEGALGVVITSTQIYFPPIWQRPFWSIYFGFKESLFWIGVVFGGFVKIFSDLFGGVIPKDVAGPVGIFALTSQAARLGLIPLINLIGVLSVNLAILNILPFPALDGGRLLFVLIEAIFGRKVIPKVEAAIHTVGMIILIVLILAITAHDIQRLIGAGGITGYIDSVLK